MRRQPQFMPLYGNSCADRHNSRRSQFMRVSAIHSDEFRLRRMNCPKDMNFPAGMNRRQAVMNCPADIRPPPYGDVRHHSISRRKCKSSPRDRIAASRSFEMRMSSKFSSPSSGVRSVSRCEFHGMIISRTSGCCSAKALSVSFCMLQSPACRHMIGVFCTASSQREISVFQTFRML